MLLFGTRSILGVLVILCSLYAGTLGLLNTFPSGVPGLQVHDLATLTLTGVAAFLVVTAGRRIRGAWTRSDVPYLLFLAWAVFRAYGVPDLFDAVKDLVFFSLFLVICMVSRLFVAEKQGRTLTVSYALFAGAALSVALLLVFVPMGAVAWTPTGLASPLGKRPLALFLMVVFSASLSVWLFSATSGTRRLGAVWSVAVGGVIVPTLSRTVIATLLVVHLPAALLLRSSRRLTSVGNAVRIPFYAVLVTAIVVLSLKNYTVQERFFFQTGGSRAEDLLYWRNLNTMGRSNVWPEIWRHAKTAPWIGHGTGSARSYSKLICGWEHPHCDYLRVFHDQGAIGLAFFVGFWLLKVRRLWALQRYGRTPAARQSAFAALVAVIGVLLSFVTDNTIVYTYAMIPLAILVGAAEAEVTASTTPTGDPGEPASAAATSQNLPAGALPAR